MESTDSTGTSRVLVAVRQAVESITGRIIVGFSGGLDSAVLLHAVARLVPPSRVLAAHVNHDAQPSAAAWEAHCRTQAASLNLPFVSCIVDLAGPGNFEARARAARYAWFAELLSADDVLLLGHHLRDQAETVLLRILQGRGVYGMPATRPLGRGHLCRPLLTVSRRDIDACAKEMSIVHVEDPTNHSALMDRSWIRRNLLPTLEARFPAFEADIERVTGASLAAETAGRFLAAELPHPLSVERLPEQPAARVEILRWWLGARGFGRVPRAVLVDWLDAIFPVAEGDTSALAIADGRLILHRAALYVQATPLPLPAALDVLAGQPLDLGHGTVELDTQAPEDRFQIRFRTGHDAVCLGGRRVKAGKILQSAVLPWERDRYPLIYRNGELIALPALAVADGVTGLGIRWLPRVPVFLPGFPKPFPDPGPGHVPGVG